MKILSAAWRYTKMSLTGRIIFQIIYNELLSPVIMCHKGEWRLIERYTGSEILMRAYLSIFLVVDANHVNHFLLLLSIISISSQYDVISKNITTFPDSPIFCCYCRYYIFYLYYQHIHTVYITHTDIQAHAYITQEE